MKRTAILCGLVTAIAGLSTATGDDGDPRGGRLLTDILMTSSQDATASCANVSYPATDRDRPTASPNPGGRVRADAYLFVVAINEIDATTSTFRFEGYGGLIWCDPRLAFDPATTGYDRRVYYGAKKVDAALNEIWWPGVFLPSQLGAPQRSNEQLTVFPDGTAEFTAKFNTRMLANYDFTDFPFDRQTLSIPVQAFPRGANQLDLGTYDDRIGFDAGFDLPEWWIRGYDARIDLVDPDDDGVAFPRFVLDVRIARKAGFYFWKVFIPIVIIVSISFSVFWMSRDVLAQRQRQAATGVLTLVAFQFVAAGSLPRVPYLTAMDAIILWSFVVAASTMVFNVRNKRRFRQDEALGVRSDQRCRWVYPAVYLTGLVLISLRRYLM